MTYPNNAQIATSISNEKASNFYEQELDLGKTKLRIRLASDRQMSSDKEEFLQRLKNFCNLRLDSSPKNSQHT